MKLPPLKPAGKAKKKVVNRNGKKVDKNETCPTCNENEDKSDEGQNWVTCVVCDSWYLVKCVTDSPNLQLSLEDENVFCAMSKV